MSFVRTLLGDISPKDMGFTLAHEHIVCKPPYWVEKKENDLLLDDPEPGKRCWIFTIAEAELSWMPPPWTTDVT